MTPDEARTRYAELRRSWLAQDDGRTAALAIAFLDDVLHAILAEAEQYHVSPEHIAALARAALGGES